MLVLFLYDVRLSLRILLKVFGVNQIIDVLLHIPVHLVTAELDQPISAHHRSCRQLHLMPPLSVMDEFNFISHFFKNPVLLLYETLNGNSVSICIDANSYKLDIFPVLVHLKELNLKIYLFDRVWSVKREVVNHQNLPSFMFYYLRRIELW